MKVSDSWVADGFDLSERIEQIEEQIASLLPSAYDHEVDVKVSVLTAPTKQQVEALRAGEVEARD